MNNFTANVKENVGLFKDKLSKVNHDTIVESLYGGYFKNHDMFKGRKWLVWLNVLSDVIMVGMLVFGLLGNEFTISSLGSVLATFGVLFIAYGSMLAYPFNMAQNVTWLITSLALRFYGNAFMALFYFCTQLFGIFVWKRNKNKKQGGLKVRKVDKKSIVLFLTGMAIMTVLVALLLGAIGGEQVWLDSANNSTAIMSQISQIVFVSQIGNIGWLVTNVLNLIQYGISLKAGNLLAYGALLQTVIQGFNGIRTIINWHYMSKKEKVEEVPTQLS